VLRQGKKFEVTDTCQGDHLLKLKTTGTFWQVKRGISDAGVLTCSGVGYLLVR
jgi:hypothetical protein